MSKVVVQIDFEVSAEVVARVQQLLDDTTLRDVDFNGSEFEILRGDGTEIMEDGGRDPYDVQRLYSAISNTIAGTVESHEGYRRDSTGKYFRE